MIYSCNNTRTPQYRNGIDVIGGGKLPQRKNFWFSGQSYHPNLRKHQKTAKNRTFIFWVFQRYFEFGCKVSQQTNSYC